GLWPQLSLDEASGALRAPGESVTLSCRISSSTFEGFSTRWYRQTPRGSLEWVSLIDHLGNVKKYGAAVEGRAAASRGSNQSQPSLVLWALDPSDSARYFCTVSHG
ncbi:HV01 protein, partial [Daphoenositta chrysoptera]|nr:HV01 protein [Daphoenositta chrysoptera]